MQHKRARNIVADAHWLGSGVSGRRKRNVTRLGNLFALREARRDHCGAAGNANLTAAEAEKSGKLIIEAVGISRTYGDRKIVDDFLDPHPARRPYRLVARRTVPARPP